MAAEPPNRLAPEMQTEADIRPPGRRGDLPERLRRRYLADPAGGGGLGFFVDARTKVAAFRDHGHALTTTTNDPGVIRDLLAIARHRGWTRVRVDGDREFRREAWLQAVAQGLDVAGYRPTPRDRAEHARRADRAGGRETEPRRAADPAAAAGRTDPAGRSADPGVERRLELIDAVLRARLPDPAARDRLLSAARARLEAWLDRGLVLAPRRTAERER